MGSRKEPFEKVQRVDGCVQGPAYGSDALVERGRLRPGYVCPAAAWALVWALHASGALVMASSNLLKFTVCFPKAKSKMMKLIEFSLLILF